MYIVVVFLYEIFSQVLKGNHMYKYIKKVIYKGFYYKKDIFVNILKKISNKKNLKGISPFCISTRFKDYRS